MVTRQEAPDENQIALYLQQNWRLIGVNIVSPITVEEEIAMSTDVYGGEFETYIWWWSGDVDPNYLLSIQSNYTLDGWSDNYFDNATYNDLYRAQLGDLDPAQRQLHVRAAQRVEYLAAPFIIIAYPYFEYAWWTDEYSGWGDMNMHPGRQIGAFWGAHPLFRELQPIGGSSGLPGIGVLGIGIGITVLTAIAVVVVLVRRRQRKSQDEIIQIPSRPNQPQQPPTPPP